MTVNAGTVQDRGDTLIFSIILLMALYAALATWGAALMNGVIEEKTSRIVEVIVRAPFAARRFKPGQFYRLQNYETLARVVDGTRLATEGLALTGGGHA